MPETSHAHCTTPRKFVIAGRLKSSSREGLSQSLPSCSSVSMARRAPIKACDPVSPTGPAYHARAIRYFFSSALDFSASAFSAARAFFKGMNSSLYHDHHLSWSQPMPIVGLPVYRDDNPTSEL